MFADNHRFAGGCRFLFLTLSKLLKLCCSYGIQCFNPGDVSNTRIPHGFHLGNNLEFPAVKKAEQPGTETSL